MPWGRRPASGCSRLRWRSARTRRSTRCSTSSNRSPHSPRRSCRRCATWISRSVSAGCLRRRREEVVATGGHSAGDTWPSARRCVLDRLTAWRDVARAAPGFAVRVRELFEAQRDKTIATLRTDGSPRISGIETEFKEGELVFGSMAKARKGADLRRDPRFALHSATVDPVEGEEAQWPGEAKVSGRAIPASAGSDGDLFRVDIAEVVHTHLNPDASMLVVEWWTPTTGLRRTERG